MHLNLPPASPDPSSKASWRRELRAARRALVDEQDETGRDHQGRALTAALLTWMEPYAERLGRADLSGWSVTAFASMATEPPTDHLIATLLDRGVRVWLPVTLPEGRLGWTPAGQPGRGQAGASPMRPDPAATGASAGSEALKQVDVALVPGLAVAHDGTRLGQGGGYYDRVIPLLRPRHVPVVAVLHDHEWLPQVPSAAHDAAVDAVLTTHGVRAVTPPG